MHCASVDWILFGGVSKKRGRSYSEASKALEDRLNEVIGIFLKLVSRDSSLMREIYSKNLKISFNS